MAQQRRLGPQVDGRLFGSIPISDGYGFPCVVPRCGFRATPTDSTVPALTVARIARDAHLEAMRTDGDVSHIQWQPDTDAIRLTYAATFSGRKRLDFTRKKVAVELA